MSAAKSNGAALGQLQRRTVDELEPHPQAGEVPGLSEAAYLAVKADIAERGLQVALEITAQGTVLDGHARLRAARELGICEIAVIVVAPRDELEHILRAALQRRQLTPSQRAALAVKLAAVAHHQSRAAERSLGNLRQGPERATLPARDEAEGLRTRELVAELAGTSARTAQDVLTVHEHNPALFDRVMRGELSANTAASQVRRALRDAAIPAAPPLPEGPFQLILADPPWSFGSPDSGFAPEQHYPTLPVEQIKAIKVPAGDDCVLFLWVVNCLLPEGLEVLHDWGFTYRSSLVWVKNAIGPGVFLKRKSGRYAIRYFDPDGRRHYETIGADRREAERALNARMRDLDTANWREPSRETLSDYTSRWLTRRDPSRTPTGREGRLGRSRLAPSTHREYRRALELHILPRLGQRPLASLRPADIDQLIAQLEEQGSAPGTIRNTITPLRKLLGDAVRHGLITNNPAARPDLPPAQEFIGQELPPQHTTAIRNALAALAPADPLRNNQPDLFHVYLFDVALGSGLRLGELRALRWQDIDRARHLLRVEQAYSRNQLKRPKSDAGIRSIPIFPSTQTALDALAARALERGTYAPAQLIFQTERGTPLHPSNLNRRIWQPALRKAKLANSEGKPRYRFHDLRHTCISRLVAAGADIKLVQTIAGHSNPLITLKRYSHLLDHRLTHAANQYDPAQTSNTPNDIS